MTKTVAIIGSGISGISAAYYLNELFDVHVYEKSEFVGGHTNTITVNDGMSDYNVDTAFMVFNRDNYANLTSMFNDLGVSTLEHTGGFNFYDLSTNIQYGTEELNLSEEEISQRYDESFQSLWKEANRFFTEAPRHFFEGKTYIPLKEYLDQNNYSENFIQSYVVQLGSACWSLPYEQMGEMPASTLIGFFMNHGTSGLGGKKVSWETVENGSRQYLLKIQALLRNPVNVNCTAENVYQKDNQVAVVINGEEKVFDYVLLATHADQAFKLLHAPTDIQRNTIGKINYNSSEVILHTDTQVLPKDASRWQSWNYGRVNKNGESVPFLVYHMNKIHGFTAKQNFLVSIDTPIEIDTSKIIRKMRMEHPIIDLELYKMQDDLYQLNNEGNVLFSGTYFSIKRAGPDFAGFHESGISSAMDAVKALKKREGIQ